MAISKKMRTLMKAAIVALAFGSASASADVKLPKVIASGTVLQQGQEIPIWGTADVGEAVTVAVGNNSASTRADAAGKWSVRLRPMKAGGPHELMIEGKNRIRLTDVLIGEVWVASGQSNMEYTMKTWAYYNGKDEIATANDPELRLLHVRKRPSVIPREVEIDREWSKCSPDSLPDFSAVAYFFGRHLRQELKVPIGLIATSCGASGIEPWTPIAGFESVGTLKSLADSVRAEQAHPAGIQPTAGSASHLYNGMDHALVPFGIRGVIWYQGESNLGSAYESLMHALINGWRIVWGQGEFPVYYVQLAPYRYRPSDPMFLLPRMWEAQTRVLAMKNTGMVVTTDLAKLDDVHPPKKHEVGRRLALCALAKTYGKSNVVYSGPLYRSMNVEGDKIRIEFDHVDGGLKSRDGKPLTWFTIAGQDGVFLNATATIDGNCVIVHSEKIHSPAAVRFGWDQLAEPNLVNAVGLPAGPFRTSSSSH
jgi:sialate O-acetylesterase